MPEGFFLNAENCKERRHRHVLIGRTSETVIKVIILFVSTSWDAILSVKGLKKSLKCPVQNNTTSIETLSLEI